MVNKQEPDNKMLVSGYFMIIADYLICYRRRCQSRSPGPGAQGVRYHYSHYIDCVIISRIVIIIISSSSSSNIIIISSSSSSIIEPGNKCSLQGTVLV